MDQQNNQAENKMKDAMEHLEKHIDYPATKQDIVKACNEMADMSQEEKEWLMNTLPEGTYEDSEEVKMVLGLKK